MQARLYELASSVPNPDFRSIAVELTTITGEPYTADQCRLKFKRMKELDSLPVTPDAEAEFVTPEPEDQFIGFRMAFFDIETTNLNAFMGRVLLASISDSWGTVTTRRAIDFEQSSVIDDSGVCEWLRDELSKYDIICGWNSKMFDVSFIVARLLRWGKPIGRLNDLKHTDPMYRARAGGGGARIGSSKLDNVAKFFRTPEQKTPLEWETWQMAQAGDEAALALVQEHCEADVLVLRRVFNHLKPLIGVIHR